MTPDLDSLDWNLLRTFYLIVEERNLTRAAGRLGVSQPSVSAALKRLEDTLGCQLIVRGSRRFELTRHGEVLHRECARIFTGVSRIGDRLAGADRDITGTVRVLAVTDVRYAPFDRALREMHLRYPSVRVQIDIVSSPQALRALSRQLAPMALCLMTQPVAGLTCEHLERETFGVFCGPTHPLFGRDDVSLDELREQGLVSFSCTNEGGTLEPMISLGAGFGLGAVTRGSSSDLREVVRMVRAGLGLGVLPMASVAYEVETGALWHLAPEGVTLGADLYLVTNPAMPLEQGEAAFLSVLRGAISDDPPAP